MQRAINPNRDTPSLARLVECRQFRFQVVRQPDQERFSLVGQTKRRQMSVALAFPLRRRNQQLIAGTERQTMADPNRSTSQALAQSRDRRSLECSHRPDAILTLDKVPPAYAHRNLAVGGQFGRAAVVQRAEEFEPSQTRLGLPAGQFQFA
ncbi:hypothetical protein BamMEX5DRAFT_2229 [Burkholderia ambifaria MEX-5]|uniref:Uncharacterized protein n=1 Tax=Burkholderia ambifaria MEX-5 TaxID=396597 RepID=B1T363_9BURK|nr:hypothetical protein BamMEX5DRAFT_2229 [Burkholderia ambifaria MEX-5]